MSPAAVDYYWCVPATRRRRRRNVCVQRPTSPTEQTRPAYRSDGILARRVPRLLHKYISGVRAKVDRPPTGMTRAPCGPPDVAEITREHDLWPFRSGQTALSVGRARIKIHNSVHETIKSASARLLVHDSTRTKLQRRTTFRRLNQYRRAMNTDTDH